MLYFTYFVTISPEGLREHHTLPPEREAALRESFPSFTQAAESYLFESEEKEGTVQELFREALHSTRPPLSRVVFLTPVALNGRDSWFTPPLRSRLEAAVASYTP